MEGIKRLLPILLGVCLVGPRGFCQKSDPGVIRIQDEEISKSEFEYAFHKNNGGDMSQALSVKQYLPLYINYRLKVCAAREAGLDTAKAFKDELSGYRHQLAQPYLTDQTVKDSYLKEAYQRYLREVDVSHILIQTRMQQDTTQAWAQIQQVYNRLKRGESFGKVARESSQDPSVRKNGGRLGFIKAFQTVLPFEEKAFSTPEGAFSEPFRTRFGYHIVKVHQQRANQGEIQVAHIMKGFPKGADVKQKETIHQEILKLYGKVQGGASFEEVARQASDDRGSAKNGGKLPWFGAGRMVPEFEKIAFSLDSIGVISQPVETVYGWHIIQLLGRKKPGSLEETKSILEHQLLRAGINVKAQKKYVDQLWSSYNGAVDSTIWDSFAAKVVGSQRADTLLLSKVGDLQDKKLFSFGEERVSLGRFVDYLIQNRTYLNSERLQAAFSQFKQEMVLNYEEAHLDEKYPDFKYLMDEYCNGMLLFEISNRKVWQKAQEDTLELEVYYKKHLDKYLGKPCFKGIVAVCSSSKSASKLKKELKKLPKDSTLINFVDTFSWDGPGEVQLKYGIFHPGDDFMVDKNLFEIKGDSKNKEQVFLSHGITESGIPEALTAIRGEVMVDYQDTLDSEWVDQLRKRYKVKVNKKALRGIK